MKINFQKLKTKEVFGMPSREIDVRRSLAQNLYMGAFGPRAYDLAYMIGNSEGPVDLNDQQVEFLMNFARENMSPYFCDALRVTMEELQEVSCTE